MYNLISQNDGTYLLPKEKGMRVPGLLVANEEILKGPEMEQPLQQMRNVAHLPGIIGYSIAMPDIHWGYGFPIGGVAAMDAEHGVISPGGVGYDINCGIRLAIAAIPFRTLTEKQKTELLNTLFLLIPAGVGHVHKNSKGLSDEDYTRLIQKGAQWSIQQGYGFQQDLDHMESHGFLEGGDLDAVSPRARDRGRHQLGTVGSGNHFVEIGEIQTIYLPEIASVWGVEQGFTYVLIHSGSRGFGHQICQDTLELYTSRGLAQGLPDPQLVAAPIQSDLGQLYLRGMTAAANFAFNNRQHILHYVRQAFHSVLSLPPEALYLVYDVCHNIAKFETHEIDGVKKKLCVHRKGATRAFGPGEAELAPMFKQTGQPVLVPGDMGRASHLMVGQGHVKTWCSACHGAGRTKSRIQCMKKWRVSDPLEYLKQQGVLVKGASFRTVSEEMPDAYKNVDTVVDSVELAGLAKKVARMRPGIVLKG